MKRASKPIRRKKARARTLSPKWALYEWAADRKPRKPLPRVGSRSKREKAELEIMRGVALDRSGGRCEMCGKKAALDVHHIIPRARGVGWVGLHTPGNAAAICRADHERVTLDPLLILECKGELGTRAEIVWKMFQEWRARS